MKSNTAIAAFSGAAALAIATAALAQIKLGVSLSATGPGAALGIAEKNTLGMLPKTLGGQPVDYIILDDATDLQPPGRMRADRLLAGGRYIGSFDVDQLVRRLASVYAADPELGALRGSESGSITRQTTTPVTPAPSGDGELREQLAMLEPDGNSRNMPIQQLSRFADIRRILERAGALYHFNGQRFDFEDGVDPATIVERLINDGVV
jgi:hypothetical protein